MFTMSQVSQIERLAICRGIFNGSGDDGGLSKV